MIRLSSTVQSRSGSRGRVIAGILGVLFLLPTLSCLGEPEVESATKDEAGDASARPAFVVPPRLDELFYYPCADCHEFMDSNDQVRELEVEEGHPAVLEHGNGLLWCLTCHGGFGYNELQSMVNEPISFDQGYLVCSSCHSKKFRDWQYGGHGKRVANWQGERLIYSCAECHNPHRPAIDPREPRRPPPVRAGLQHLEGVDERPEPLWHSYQKAAPDER